MKKPYKFNPGEQYKCLPGFSIAENSGGAGYVPGKIITVKESHARHNGRFLIWPAHEEFGIYSTVLIAVDEKNIFVSGKLK